MKVMKILLMILIVLYITSINNKYAEIDNKPNSYLVDWSSQLLNIKQSDLNYYKPKIVILDTGVDFANPLLSSSKYIDIDISNEKDNDRVHGSKVAGIIAANGKDFKGILPFSRLISIKLGSENGWNIEKLCEGLEIAIELKPDVINISSGISKDNARLRELVKKATEEKIVIVAAAGNNDSPECDFPAAYAEVLSVGAIDRGLNIAANSNYGDEIKVFAPGEDILTIQTGEKEIIYDTFRGTSASAAFATCLVAAIKAKNPLLMPEEIINKLISTSDEVRYKDRIIKIINYKKALY